MSTFVKYGLVTGLLGDAVLQLIVYSSEEEDLWGLKSYFDHHGSIPSLFIASGMMGVFTWLYELINPGLNPYGMSLYATGLDLLFRTQRIMPSLDKYYANLSTFRSIMWAIIPLMLPRFASQIGIYA